MHIAKATEHYESWLATYTTTVQKDGSPAKLVLWLSPLIGE
jgi:hypothetical protein